MKNYRNLVPIVLVFLMAISTYMLVNDAKKQETEYLSHLETAREKREEKLLSDAITSYSAAIEMRPSLELYEEVADTLLELGTPKQQEEWGEQMVADYPTASQGYEYLISLYLADEEYTNCYELYAEVKERKLLTENIEEMMSQIEYVYEIGYAQYQEIGVYAGGYCAVLKKDKWGYIDERGNSVINHQYEEAGVFADGLAYVRDSEGEHYFVDSTNAIKLHAKVDKEAKMCGILSEGRYPVEIDGEYYFADEDGKLVSGPYLGISSYNFGKAAVLTEEGWTFVDTDGNKLTDNIYRDVKLDGKGIAFRNGRAFVETEEGIRMIDENFAVVGELVFDDAVPFYEGGDTYAAVKIGATWGFVDTAGQICIPCEYAGADSFMNGYGAVCVRDAWGYMDKNGEIVIDTVFEAAAPFNASGCAMIKEHGLWSLLKLTKDNW